MNELPIHAINIGTRHRKDMGDLEALAASIRDTGLLQAIGVTPDHDLVFGERRLRACRDILKWEAIPARIIHVPSIVLGEFTEQEMRKDFTPSERVAIVETLRGYGHGGDRRSNQRPKGDVEGLTAKDAAKKVGFCRNDYFRARAVVEKGVPDLVEAMDQGKVSISLAATVAELDKGEQVEVLKRCRHEERWVAGGLKRQVNRVRRERQRQEAEAKELLQARPEDRLRLYHCAFQQLEGVAGIAPNSARLVFTDPPWTTDWLPFWNDLGAFAARVLQDGGLLMSYVPAVYLDRVMLDLGRHLRYTYILTVIHRTRPRQHVVRVREGCLPILVYAKGQPDLRREIINPILGGGRQKEWHDWQQNVEEARYLISQTVDDGELIIDTCLGGATTAEAVVRLGGGRRFIGCDIDRASVVSGHERLARLGSAA